MKLSIVTPVYHEEKNIIRLIAQIDKHIKTPHELVVVYDRKDDPTYDVVKQFIASNKRRDIRLLQNNVGSKRGALNAVLSGILSAKHRAVLVTMADLSDDLAKADRMFKMFEEGATVVCASRYMRGGQQIGGPLLKRLMSRVAGVSLHYIRRIPTHDITNNYRLYDRDFVKSLTIESKAGFEVAMEITVKAFLAGKTVTEVPATWRDRTDGESNFKLWKWLPSYMRWYVHALTQKKASNHG